ncbi:MAG TPA: hypothetical protein VI112_02830 [Bacteroidia bacterium]|jgi:hypothetical protein
MDFDSKIEFRNCANTLRELIARDDYRTQLLKWIEEKSQAGFSKLKIYQLLSRFLVELSVPGDETHFDRLADLMDGFTSWTNEKILAGEPDVE